MDVNWQFVATIACIALAAVIVLRRIVRLFRSPASGCGSACSGCSKQGSSPTADGFVSLDSLVKGTASLKR